LPGEIGLVETHHALLANGLRSRVKLRVDGGFKNGRDRNPRDAVGSR